MNLKLTKKHKVVFSWMDFNTIMQNDHVTSVFNKLFPFVRESCKENNVFHSVDIAYDSAQKTFSQSQREEFYLLRGDPSEKKNFLIYTLNWKDVVTSISRNYFYLKNYQKGNKFCFSIIISPGNRITFKNGYYYQWHVKWSCRTKT